MSWVEFKRPNSYFYYAINGYYAILVLIKMNKDVDDLLENPKKKFFGQIAQLQLLRNFNPIKPIFLNPLLIRLINYQLIKQENNCPIVSKCY